MTLRRGRSRCPTTCGPRWTRPGASATFDSLSFTHRKEHVRAIEDAKTPETRQRRIAKAVEKLTAG